MSLGNYKIATLEFREFGKLQNHYLGVYGVWKITKSLQWRLGNLGN